MNSRDIELLSAYLDGELSPSDSARLESRLASDSELVSVFNDIRLARGILRNLPARKAPRNFMLTRKMVGLKPPLPRSYSLFRFSSAFATILLLLTFAANSIVTRVSFGAAAPAPQSGGYGGGPGLGGGGGGCGAEPCFPPVLQNPSGAGVATEAPAATEASALAEMQPQGTETPPSGLADSNRQQETPTPEASLPKEAPTASGLPEQPPVKDEAAVFVPPLWQTVLLAVALISALTAFMMSQSSKRKWKQ